jgi:hypothetical protein
MDVNRYTVLRTEDGTLWLLVPGVGEEKCTLYLLTKRPALSGYRAERDGSGIVIYGKEGNVIHKVSNIETILREEPFN